MVKHFIYVLGAISLGGKLEGVMPSNFVITWLLAIDTFSPSVSFKFKIHVT